MKKKKWRYFLYIVNAYSIGFVSISLILSLRALMQSYPEPAQNLLYYMGEFIFSPFGFILALCIAWDLGCFLLWLSKKGRKTKKGAALWLQVLFLVSLLPYIVLLILCIHSYFVGVNTGWWVSNMEYGWAAVRYTAFWYLLILTGIPVLPVCIIIQIVYIIHRVQNKR